MPAQQKLSRPVMAFLVQAGWLPELGLCGGVAGPGSAFPMVIGFRRQVPAAAAAGPSGGPRR
jgi:hypothetical protein